DYKWIFNIPNNKSFESYGCLYRIDKKDKKNTKNIEYTHEENNISSIQHAWGTSSKNYITINDSNYNNQSIVFHFGYKNMKKYDIKLKSMLFLLIYYPIMCALINLWI